MTIRRGSMKRGSLVKGALYTTALFGTAAVTATVGVTGTADAQTTEELLKRIEMLEAERVHSGRKGIKVTVNGQVNRLLVFSDEGDRASGETADIRQIHHTDNANATSSRFRFLSSGKASDMVTIGSAIEIDIRPNRGNVSQTGDLESTSANAFRNRLLNVYVSHAKIGKITIGRQWTAGWYGAGASFDGTGAALAINDPILVTGVRFRDEDTSALLGTSAGGVYDGLAQNYRANAIRYDSPKLVGASFAFSYSDDEYQGGFDYKNNFGGFGVEAKLGYHFRGNNTAPKGANWDRIMGSIGFSVAGLHLSVGGAQNRNDRRDGIRDGDQRFGYRITGGYKNNITGAGNTSLTLVFHRSENRPDPNDATSIVAAAIQQDINKTGTNLYVLGSYINHENGGGTGANNVNAAGGFIKYKPIFQIGLGARQRF